MHECECEHKQLCECGLYNSDGPRPRMPPLSDALVHSSLDDSLAVSVRVLPPIGYVGSLVGLEDGE